MTKLALPGEIILEISKYLDIRSYHRLRASTRAIAVVLPRKPTLNFDAYRESISFQFIEATGYHFKLQELCYIDFHSAQKPAIYQYLISNRLDKELGRFLLNLSPLKKIDPTIFESHALKFSLFRSDLRLLEILLRDDRFGTLEITELFVEACACGKYSFVSRLLLDQRCDLTIPSSHRALVCAAELGLDQIVSAILCDGRIDPGFLDQEALIVAVQNDHPKVVQALLQDLVRINPADNSDYCFKLAAECGQLEMVNTLLQDSRVDPAASNNYAVCMAANRGHYSVLEVLLKDSRVDPSVLNDYPVRTAMEEGHIKCFLLLSKHQRVNLANLDDYLIRVASEMGLTEVVEVLLSDPKVNPGSYNNYAIRIACKKGFSKIVEHLLKHPKTDPTDGNNDAFISAAKYGHCKCISLLLDDGRIDPQCNKNYAISLANSNGHADVVSVVLSFLDTPRFRRSKRGSRSTSS